VVPDALMLVIGVGVGLLLQWCVYLFARRPHLLATPNERSSHTEPTPTMGGVVMALVVVAYFAQLASVDPRIGWGLCGACAAVAGVGLWDDLRGLGARFRIVVHALAAAMVLWALQLPLQIWALAVLLVAVVWFINLYNFMDGIDGYAAVQALVFCLGAHIVAGGVAGWTGDLLWLLAGATLAFLGFNWPPAKIFMGDVGSGFLGLLIAALSLYMWQAADVPLVASLILLTGFWFDATYTLCVRIVTRQEFTQAHRQHLYQHLAMRRGHLWTTMAFLSYAAVWLIPLAWFASNFTELIFVQTAALIAAVLPMALGCWRLQAGFNAQTD